MIALPLLLLMFALILSVGVFSLSYLQTTVNARRDAWQQRSSHQSSQPMAYIPQTSRIDIFSTEASEAPLYPSPKLNFGSVQSHHDVLGGAWDHRELLKGNGPHWDDMARASITGNGNQIASLLNQFSNAFDPSNIPDMLSDAAVQMLTGELSSLQGQSQQIETEAQQKLENEAKKLEKRNEELTAEKTALQKEIDTDLVPKRDQLTQQIEDRKKLIEMEKDPAKKKKLEDEQKQDEQELKDVNAEIQTKQNRIKEIDREIEANNRLISELRS